MIPCCTVVSTCGCSIFTVHVVTSYAGLKLFDNDNQERRLRTAASSRQAKKSPEVVGEKALTVQRETAEPCDRELTIATWWAELSFVRKSYLWCTCA